MAEYIAAAPTRRHEASLIGKWAWAFFDWAGQPFFTLVTTFIFAPYFATAFIGDPVEGQAMWGYGQSLAGFLIALFSPLLGAMADAGGRRKPWLLFFSLFYVLSASLLWYALPGAPGLSLGVVLTALIVATVCAEFTSIFNNAMLPDIVPPAHIGRWSGIGWGLGYIGGLLSLGLVLMAFVLTETPLLGLDKDSHEPDRFVGPLSALWYAVFVLPLFFFTPDQSVRIRKISATFNEGVRRLIDTLKKARQFGNAARFLLARMIYQDGLNAIFAFGGIYAAGTFGWKIETLAIFGIVLSVFAALGAFAGGWLDDRLGSKRTIIISLLGLFFGTLLAMSITADHVLFVIETAPVQVTGGLFASPPEKFYLLAGIIIGFSGGPAQAASRTLMARIAPPAMMAEFFGLFAFSGKATAFAAPFLIALVTASFASQRLGLAVVLVFLVGGLALFLRVRETAG